MAKKVIDLSIQDVVKLIHRILDPSWRIADRDDRAISKLARVVYNLINKANQEGFGRASGF